jgi:hypothetical protein
MHGTYMFLVIFRLVRTCVLFTTNIASVDTRLRGRENDFATYGHLRSASQWSLGSSLKDPVRTAAKRQGVNDSVLWAHDPDAAAHASQVVTSVFSEELLMGYKYFDETGKTPLFAFGHRLGFASPWPT